MVLMVAWRSPKPKVEVQILLLLFEKNYKNYLPCWLNWYSIGLENRHSVRISEFESLARRLYGMVEQVV